MSRSFVINDGINISVSLASRGAILLSGGSEISPEQEVDLGSALHHSNVNSPVFISYSNLRGMPAVLAGNGLTTASRILPPLSRVAEVWARFRKEVGRLRRWANQEKFSPFQ